MQDNVQVYNIRFPAQFFGQEQFHYVILAANRCIGAPLLQWSAISCCCGMVCNADSIHEPLRCTPSTLGLKAVNWAARFPVRGTRSRRWCSDNAGDSRSSLACKGGGSWLVQRMAPQTHMEGTYMYIYIYIITIIIYIFSVTIFISIVIVIRFLMLLFDFDAPSL